MRTIQRDIVAALIFSKDGKLFQGMKDPTGVKNYTLTPPSVELFKKLHYLP